MCTDLRTLCDISPTPAPRRLLSPKDTMSTTCPHPWCISPRASRWQAAMPQKAPMTAVSAHSREIGTAIRGTRASSPHEIGYFLGYPYEDVHQFIVQHGENYKVFGAWKVYTNVEQALTTFDSYRACTQYLTHIYQQGHSLAKLAQAAR